MRRRITAVIPFIMRSATGPNPDNKEFELLDSDGDRMAYVSSIQESREAIRDVITDAIGGTLEVI